MASIDYILPGVPRVEKAWDCARHDLQPGDVCLWEPHDAISYAIARETKGPFCHASVVDIVHATPIDMGYHYASDGCMTLLRHQVQLHSGKISVFRIPGLHDAERRTVAAYAMNGLGGAYAIDNIALIALGQFGIGRLLGLIPPLKRWYLDRVRRQSRKKSSAICSQNVHRAYREGLRLNLVSGKAEALVSPNDLARSARLKYQFSMTYPQNWAA